MSKLFLTSEVKDRFVSESAMLFMDKSIKDSNFITFAKDYQRK